MKLIYLFIIVLLSILFIASCYATSAWDNFTDEQIVNAIYQAENSVKYPYGIKSIDTKGDKEYARKICFNSVRNGRARWEKAGRPDDLITHIGLRYCPVGADNDNGTNKFWTKNVKFFLDKLQ